MTVVESDGRLVIVDTGLMFPTADMLGIDLVLPDFASLRERADDIEAIVLTHGHEDHVGALPYFLREVGIPPVIYGGLLTIGMVRSKLDEHKLRDVPLEELPAGEKTEVGPFGLELIHMSHSIPDARAVALTTDHGTVLITGDYKFDQTPVDGIPADVSRLAELGRDGVLCLCGDSTNADRPGVAPSESSVGPGAAGGLLPLQGPHHRHLVRLQHPPRPAGDRRRRAARPQGRPGRPLDAQELQHRLQPGHRRRARRLFIQPKEIEDFPDEKVVVISTGSQGEPLSALRRMAHNDHRDVELHSGDTVIFSATPIPGNERSVNETIDRIFQIGASGGDGRRRADPRLGPRLAGGAEADAEPDQAALRLPLPRRPQAAAAARRPGRVGRHRARRHLHRAQRPRAGDRRAGARFGEDVHATMIFVDGVSVGEPDEFALRDRRKLSDDGVFIVVATDLGRRRLPGRRARGDLPRASPSPRRPTACATSSATWWPTPWPRPPRTRSARSPCSSRTCTTTSPSSSTRSLAAGPWCCRSSSRSERAPGQRRTYLWTLAGAAALVLLILWFLRPWFHGPVMFFYKHPLIWLPMVGVLVASGFIARRLMSSQPTTRSRGFVTAGLLVASLFALIVFSVLEGALVQRSIYTNTTYEEIPGLPAGGTVRIVPREVAVEIASSGFNSPTEHADRLPGRCRRRRGLRWNALRTPDGVVRIFTKKSQGLVTLDASSTERRVTSS